MQHSALLVVVAAVMPIAQDWVLPTKIASLQADAPFRIGKHSVHLYIFPGCAIVCHEDIDHYIDFAHTSFQENPNAAETIAPLCTLVIPKPESAHAALRQPEMVKEALTHWRKCVEGDLNILADEHQIAIADPSTVAITSLWKEVET
jgi:hypothetical protein